MNKYNGTATIFFVRKVDVTTTKKKIYQKKKIKNTDSIIEIFSLRERYL